MAHVPAAAETVTPNSIRTADSTTRKKPVRKNDTRTGSNKTENTADTKKTFSDLLNKAGKSGKKPLHKKLHSDHSEKKLKRTDTPEGRIIRRTLSVESDELEPDQIIGRNENPGQEQTIHAAAEGHDVAALPVHAAVLSSQTNHVRESVSLKKTGVSRNKRIGKHSGTSRHTTLQSSKNSAAADLSSTAPRVEVVDNRNHPSEEDNGNNDSNPSERKSHRLSNTADHRSVPEAVRFEHNPAAGKREMDIDVRGGQKGSGPSAAENLARKLDARAGNDIVRQVKVILNQADSGELHINLRPDNLGQVKIRIRMENNRLTGRIFVESAAAREAFRNALDGLQTRLVESGFGAADLEMAWDESPREFLQDGRQKQNRKDNLNEAIQEFDNIVPVVFGDGPADGRVNMVI